MKKAIFILALLGLIATSCASNKKNRCNTCPKWEDRVETVGEVK
ncbi:MAG: hypothetical protein ACOVMR_05145 [Flavobacteriales bacterium]